jgi:hypothetical protein
MALSRSLTIEPVRAFNGLDVLVARDEGLFEAEDLDLRFATPDAGQARSTERGTLLAPTSSQGLLVDQHRAAMFQG